MSNKSQSIKIFTNTFDLLFSSLNKIQRNDDDNRALFASNPLFCGLIFFSLSEKITKILCGIRQCSFLSGLSMNIYSFITTLLEISVHNYKFYAWKIIINGDQEWCEQKAQLSVYYYIPHKTFSKGLQQNFSCGFL